MIERICGILASCGDILCATNIEIYDCIPASRRVRVSADGRIIENPTSTDVWFSDDSETLCVKAVQVLYL